MGGLRSHFSLGLLGGAILAALGRHALQSLVGVPSWLEAGSAAAIALALVRSSPLTFVAVALACGAAVSFALPDAVAPPSSEVMTHAPPRSGNVDLFDALQKLDDEPSSLAGKRITVSGLWRPARDGMPAAVFRVVMACCVADAVDVGFDVRPERSVRIADGSTVQVSGVPSMVIESGETRFELRNARVQLR
jgi:hypothetical protein